MKKALKYTGRGFLALLIVVNLVIVFSGRFYIYKGVWYTYFRGVAGPQIDEAHIFENRTVENAAPQPWLFHASYKQSKLSKPALERHAKLQSAGLVIIKDGHLLFEQYFNDFTADSRTHSFSVAKSIVGTLIGCALEEGAIGSLSDPVGKYLSGFKEGKKTSVTLDHLLTMSSGLNWSESGSNPFSDNAEAYYGWNLQSIVDNLEVTETPGRSWRYLSGNTVLLGMVLEKATGKTLSRYASEKLWKPLHAEHPALWNMDAPDGLEKSYCCFYATARDYARFGQLMLNDGNWNGQQLVKTEYIRNAFADNGLEDVIRKRKTGSYGRHWWREKYRGKRIYYARGLNGQYIFVIPEMNVVVVRTGRKRLPVTENNHPADIYYWLDDAFELTGTP